MDYENQLQAKLKAASQQETCGTSAIPMGLHNDDCCDTQAPQTQRTDAGYARKYPENVVVELRSRAEHLRADAKSVSRVCSIIEKHPEFLEFLEVLRSGLL
jgi:hypothetical protein